MPSRSGSARPIFSDVVHGAEQIGDFLVAPVGEYRFLIGAAPAVAAAIVDRHDHIAVRGEQLALEVERLFVLAVGPAMDSEKRRVLPPGDVAGWLDDEAVNLGAVATRGSEWLGRAEPDPVRPLVVLMRQASWLPVFNRVDLRNLGGARHERRKSPVRRRRDRCDDPRAGDDLFDRPTRSGHSRDALRTIVDGDEGDRAAVGGPNRSGHGSVKRVGQGFRRATGCRNDGKAMLIVSGVLRLVAQQVRDRRAIRTPRDPSRLLGRRRRQPSGLRAGARLDDEEIPVRSLVDVAVPVPPDERDPLAVR